MTESQQKLLVIITSNSDGDVLVDKLTERGYPATKVSSTGGFLQRGNATIFSGISEDEIDPVMAIIRQSCQVRTETISSTALPFPSNPSSDPIEVRVGGAIVFALDVSKFEKI